jgi:hypothetical protein
MKKFINGGLLNAFKKTGILKRKIFLGGLEGRCL